MFAILIQLGQNYLMNELFTLLHFDARLYLVVHLLYDFYLA
jgi:hypothetical protein